MTHELFSPITDPQLVETCSEIFTGDYRYVEDKEQIARYGTGRELLTNPDIQLLSVQASYMEEAPEGGLRNAIKVFTFGPKLPPTERVLEVYTNSIGKLQQWGTEDLMIILMSTIKQFEKGGWPAVSAWYGEEIAKTGRSLLSAHFLGRVAGDSNVLVETLVYPEHIRKLLRVLIREGFDSSLPQLDAERQATVRDVLRDNERVYTAAGDVSAANQLLNPEDFQRLVGPSLSLLS